MQHTKVIRHDINTTGRDFVVGDIHGCLDIFNLMLEKINFNKEVDRMFSVGDLVDRGPKSLECLKLIYEPWFYPVYANHEDFMVYGVKPDNTNFIWESNGGSWHLWEDKTALKDAANFIEEHIPFIRVVDTPSGRVNIVHAQINRNLALQPATDKDIDIWDFTDYHENSMIWGRDITKQPGSPFIRPGLSTTYCGHTVILNTYQRQSHRFIDTGCVFGVLADDDLGYGLTVVDLTNEIVHNINSKTLEYKNNTTEEVFRAV